MIPSSDKIIFNFSVLWMLCPVHCTLTKLWNSLVFINFPFCLYQKKGNIAFVLRCLKCVSGYSTSQSLEPLFFGIRILIIGTNLGCLFLHFELLRILQRTVRYLCKTTFWSFFMWPLFECCSLRKRLSGGELLTVNRFEGGRFFADVYGHFISHNTMSKAMRCCYDIILK